jgi:hypothetical protein
MLATFFTQADNLAGPAPISGANTAVHVLRLSTVEAYAWETPLEGYGNFKTLSTDEIGETPYNPEMVELLLRLKARAPVAEFKNAREAIERLYPSKG